MRIHTLTFQAIGPYATQQYLDFSVLDDVGLFLLDGPTGAGKSTILDIITFALYGKADDERKNTELHSTLAEPGLPPTIQLDVTFGTRRFVIDRTLQHVAPRRGAKDPSDVVTRQASMTLVEVVAGQHRNLTTRVDEAQQILRGVIGLSREQFTSVVLLPQGEFARFLKASSSEREEILRQLFNTHRFEEIGAYLADEAKQLRGTVEADHDRRDRLRNTLIETVETYQPRLELALQGAGDQAETTAPLFADPTEPHEPKDLTALADEALIDHADEIMTRLETTAAHEVNRATKAFQTAQARAQQLAQQQEQLHEAQEFRRRCKTHEAQAETVQAAKGELEHHERALAVVEAQRHCETARDQLTEVIEQLQTHCDSAQEDAMVVEWCAGQELFTVDEHHTQQLFDGWKSVEAAAIRALENLEYQEKTQARIIAAQRQVRQLETSRDELQQRVATLDQRLVTIAEQLTSDQQQAEHLAGVEQVLHNASERLQSAQTKQTAAEQAAAAQTIVEHAKTDRETAQHAADEAAEYAQSLLRRRIEAAAGFLAEELEPGQPCEVCGSTQHPDPAAAQGLTEISNAAVKQAEEDATVQRRAANTAAEHYQEKLRDLHDLQTQAGGLSVAEATAEAKAASQAVTTAQADVQQLTTLRGRIKSGQDQTETLRADKSAAEQELAQVSTQLAALKEELTTAQQQLHEALGDYETVAQLRAAVEPAHRLVTQIMQQATAVSTAIATHTTAMQRVDEALAQSATKQHAAFADAKTAQAHVLEPEALQGQQALVQQWTTESDRLAEKAGQSAVIVGLKLLQDAVEVPSDQALAQAQQDQHAAEAEVSAANREHGSIQATHQQCRGYQEQLAAVSRRSAQQRAVYEELVGLSDVVAGRGENAVSMPLRSFVLAGWLERVAANASERLTGMTGGRYELKHTVRQGGRGHSGLNLEVIDHLNDTARTPSTLSGGETFMASLALALGLADAVQAQAGGVAMDTLFIDEGFGSLDADTLEEVMGVLATLQDDGRLIGLVSHVESMKQQIPHRVRVTKAQTGSSVKIIGPDLA